MTPSIIPSYSPIFASLLLILVVFWKSRKARGSILLPPGPRKLPIIGNLHLLAGNPRLPHHLFGDLAKIYGPIMHLKLGQLEATIISSSKLAQEVLKTNELTFAQRPPVLAVDVMSYGQGSIAFAPHGDFWREMRKITVFELLGTKRVDSFRSIREEEVWNLVHEICNNDSQVPINFSEKSFSLTNATLSRTAFGAKCKDAKEFIASVQVAAKLAGGFDIPDVYPSLRILGYVTGSIPAMKRIANKIEKILESIINDHKKKRSDNFRPGEDEEDTVDVLLTVQESNKLEFNFTNNQMKDVVLDIFSAGSVTSATALTWVMSLLMKYPRVMKNAQDEVREKLRAQKSIDQTDIQKLDYLKSVIKETMRLYPPVPLLPREARERCKIGGYEIPVGAKVIMNARAIGRDPQNWVDAELFNPERFLHGGNSSNIDFKGFHFDLIPFGAGRRMCPGISYSMAAMELALAQLLYHFDWKLPNGMKPDELDMSETFGVTCGRKSDLYVVATPHFPSLSKA